MKRRLAPHVRAERMDDPALDPDTLAACLADLAAVNRQSFGYRPTIAFVRRATQRAQLKRPLRVLDVGCGSGDTLRVLARELAKDGTPAELTGADLNPHAAAIARAQSPPQVGPVKLAFVVADARALARERADSAPPDIIINALFMHHLEDEEIVDMLRFMDGSARVGWFVNDLYRSAFAARGFAALALLTRKHAIVRHDGPLSFARAFRAPEWRTHLEAAQIDGARVRIGAPFRMCVEKLA